MRQFRKNVEFPFPLAGVPGTGNHRRPKVMIVQNRPGGGVMQGVFASRAGQVYARELLEKGITEKDVYVTSALKTKRPSDVAAGYEYAMWKQTLLQEIQLVQPEKLIAVGETAKRMILELKGQQSAERVSSTKKEAGQLQSDN